VGAQVTETAHALIKRARKAAGQEAEAAAEPAQAAPKPAEAAPKPAEAAPSETAKADAAPAEASEPAPSALLHAPAEIGLGVEVTLQGFVENLDSTARHPGSVTNAIVVRAE
jgi:hypothetical protein